jgi:hypothetical protein
MKLDLNSDKALEALRKFVSDLRGNRLWPLAIVLLVAIVAVPIALSKSSAGTPVASVPPATPPASSTAIRALNVQTQPGHSRLHGHGRDPFPGSSGQATTSTTGATTPTGSSTTAGSGSTATGSVSGGTSGSTGSQTGSAPPPTSTNVTPPSITPNKKPKPAPSGLTSTQSYDVALSITNSSGGLDSIDPLERLTVLPSVRQPLMVELGVLKGGKQVLFAVLPGTVVAGPGTCTPGPIDCEILSLGQDQTEELGIPSPDGPVGVALFAVTGISAQQHASTAEADKVRHAESQEGRDLLTSDGPNLGALGLFHYDPSVGAVVDLRNLTAGDN